MLYDPIHNHCERLMELYTMINKVRAALSSLGRQLVQLLFTRHKYGREVGKVTEHMMLEELIGTIGYPAKPFRVVSIEAALECCGNGS